MLTKRLCEVREQFNFNKKEMADFLGIPYTTYNNYETGLREPGSETLILMAKKFKVSIDYLLGLSPAPVSTDDIRDICLKTGLSDAAVKIILSIPERINLHPFGTVEAERLFIERLITHENFSDMSELYESIQTIIDQRNMLEKPDEYPKDIKEALDSKEYNFVKLIHKFLRPDEHMRIHDNQMSIDDL